MSTIELYREAFNRLKTGAPIRIPVGSAINNDNVCLEAGRKRGGLKRSRELFIDLIQDIDACKAKMVTGNRATAREDKSAQEKDQFKSLYKALLSDQLSLLEELLECRKLLNTLAGQKVQGIRTAPNGRP